MFYQLHHGNGEDSNLSPATLTAAVGTLGHASGNVPLLFLNDKLCPITQNVIQLNRRPAAGPYFKSLLQAVLARLSYSAVPNALDFLTQGVGGLSE